MMRELAAAGVADRFHLYVLSDTSLPEIAALEEKRASPRSPTNGAAASPVTYRRREVNTGFKAGNFWDFCQRWGDNHEFAVTLDTDSFMTAAAIMRMVRIMQADPKLGILQGLVVGLPSTSAFARIFQFGMRLGMRSFTIGSAWWQADCGPYWGHNAALRIAPFKAHCDIPTLPGEGVLRGHVLSHDQIEAALMRRGGYDVRVLPEENLGWEENPPTLIEFIRRDQRWCQGNAAIRLLPVPAGPEIRQPLPACVCDDDVSRLAGLDRPARRRHAGGRARAFDLRTSSAPMRVTPCSRSCGDVVHAEDRNRASTCWRGRELRRAFGGTARFLASVVIETCFFFLLSPIMWFCHTLFFAGLPFGRVDRLDRTGARRPHRSVVGGVQAALAAHRAGARSSRGPRRDASGARSPYALLIAGGLAVSIPFAVHHRAAGVGAALARIGIGRLPEESAPPQALAALALPALAAAARAA